jgi:hypothetical protein
LNVKGHFVRLHVMLWISSHTMCRLIAFWAVICWLFLHIILICHGLEWWIACFNGAWWWPKTVSCTASVAIRDTTNFQVTYKNKQRDCPVWNLNCVVVCAVIWMQSTSYRCIWIGQVLVLCLLNFKWSLGPTSLSLFFFCRTRHITTDVLIFLGHYYLHNELGSFKL